MNALKKYLAEFIGTFTLVLLACGTAAVVGCASDKGTGYLLTALAFGPAIFVGGEALSSLWVFILAPLVGGVLAALVYKFLAGKKADKE